MKILYIAPTDPTLTGNGAEQRTHRLWRKLQAMGDVRVVTCDELGDRSMSAAMFRRVFRPMEWPWRLFRRRRPWGDEKFDLVVARYLNVAVRARAWEIAPCKVDVDDLPSEAFASIWSRRWPVGLRWLLSRVVAAWERAVLRGISGAWVSKADDAAYVSRFCPCDVFPNAPLPPKPGYRATGRQRKMLLSVGPLYYPPNGRGVAWFVREVWPKVRARFPDFEYVAAGAGRIDARADGVTFAGFVEDVDSLYEEAAAVVAPVQSGAGTSIKVLEAISRGRPVFATPCAVRGLGDETKDGEVHVCQSADEMSDAICEWIGRNAGRLSSEGSS